MSNGSPRVHHVATLAAIPFVVAVAIALAAAPAGAQDSVPEPSPAPSSAPVLATVERRSPPPPVAWTEAWRLDVSRGGSAPLVWNDSRILIASLDRNVHVVSLDGPKVVWKETFKGGFEAAPVVTEERIYLAEMRRGARLVALDRGSQRVLWAAEAGDLVAPPIVTPDRIYTVSSIGELRAFDEAGVERWLTELETRVTSAPALLDGTLVVAASNGELYAVDASDGSVRDSTHPGAGPVWGHPLVRTDSGTAIFATLEGLLIEVDDDLQVVQQRSFPSRFYLGPEEVAGDLLLVGHEGTIWRYDWDGSEIVWHAELPSTLRSLPRISGGVIGIGSLEGVFHLIDLSTGDPLWQARLDGAITSRPLAREREFFVFTERGTLYAFRPAGAAR
ncbi:MAG: PQQ-binding-like beta-propeller repeat protein [Gemmatimonadota bacterium]